MGNRPLHTKTQSLYCLVIILSFGAIFFSCKKKGDDNGGDITPPFAITQKAELGSTCSELYLTAKHDNTGRNYLYLAAKEGGLKVFNVSGSTPQLVKTIGIGNLGLLQVMNLSQNGNYLYLALGNHFGVAQQSPGFAIIDVTDPLNPLVKKVWNNNALTGGTGIIETEGNYAYLGAMGNGLMIFDISDKTNPVLQSTFKPNIYYPDINPDPAKFNARGMVVKNNIVYLCFDAGGVRIVNVTDKQHPRETGRFANPALNGKPRAYNHIVVNGTYAYVTADYCGMEVLNIADTAAIGLSGWWNPWNCETSPLNWFSSNGHTNEIAFDAAKKLVFMSSGKSDLQVADVTDPAHPKFKYEFGGVNNGIGTWGVSVYDNNIYLTYICSAIPFASNWTGLKLLSYN